MPPVCEVCRDTHLNGEDPCTSCPEPCDLCGDTLGAFCLDTPCCCECHRGYDPERVRELLVIAQRVVERYEHRYGAAAALAVAVTELRDCILEVKFSKDDTEG